MKYLLLIYGAEDAHTDDERKECMVESLRICDELTRQGKFLSTSPLQSVTTAATVRQRDGRPLITDGPFAETREQLGGYFLLELADLDEAISVAAKLPSIARSKGVAEIRPVLSLDGLPPSRSIESAWNDPQLTPYILLCYDDDAAWHNAGPTARPEAMAEAAGLCRKLSEAGQYVYASPLYPVGTATCVRVQNGKRTITDGPFAETHEVLGGFYVILAESRDAAYTIAAQHPGLRFGSVEVRPLFDFTYLKQSPAIV